MNRRSLIGSLVSLAAFPLSLWGDKRKQPAFDASTKPIFGPEYPILIRFELEEQMTWSPWARAKVIGTLGWDSPAKARAYHDLKRITVWNPRIGLAAWVGYGTFRGKVGDKGYAVLSPGFRQPTANNREPLPVVVSMDGSELELV